jgi:hypothetical protein
VQLLTLLTFKVARQFFVQRIWYRLKRLGLDVSRRSRDLLRSRLGQLGQRVGLGVGTERLGLGLRTQRLDLGLGLEGLVLIPNRR